MKRTIENFEYRNGVKYIEARRDDTGQTVWIPAPIQTEQTKGRTKKRIDWENILDEYLSDAMWGVYEKEDVMVFVKSLLSTQELKHKEQMLKSIKLSDERAKRLIQEHKKELRKAIDEAFKMGEMLGSMHHWGLTEMRSNGYQEREELYKKYEIN